MLEMRRELRKMRPRSARRFLGRSHLLLRVHFLRRLCPVDSRRKVPELRRRARKAPDARPRQGVLMQPRAVDVIVAGGFAAGLLDIVNAIVFWRLYSGTSATLILQSVAAGVQGKAAFAGGATSAAFGLALHFLIMFGMAAVYWLACRRWPWMIARPIAAGVAYGLLTWIAMNYVIVPLSRAPRHRVLSCPGSSTACWPTSFSLACFSRSSPVGPRRDDPKLETGSLAGKVPASALSSKSSRCSLSDPPMGHSGPALAGCLSVVSYALQPRRNARESRP